MWSYLKQVINNDLTKHQYKISEYLNASLFIVLNCYNIYSLKKYCFLSFDVGCMNILLLVSIF